MGLLCRATFLYSDRHDIFTFHHCQGIASFPSRDSPLRHGGRYKGAGVEPLDPVDQEGHEMILNICETTVDELETTMNGAIPRKPMKG